MTSTLSNLSVAPESENIGFPASNRVTELEIFSNRGSKFWPSNFLHWSCFDIVPLPNEPVRDPLLLLAPGVIWRHMYIYWCVHRVWYVLYNILMPAFFMVRWLLKSHKYFTGEKELILPSCNPLKMKRNRHLQGVIHPSYMRYLFRGGLNCHEMFLSLHWLQRDLKQPVQVQCLLFQCLLFQCLKPAEGNPSLINCSAWKEDSSITVSTQKELMISV